MVASERVASVLALVGVVLLLLLGGRPARAGSPERGPAPVAEEPAQSASGLDFELPDDPERVPLIWHPASVAWPLPPLSDAPESFAELAARLEHHVAMLEGRVSAPSVRGPVELDEERAAGVWIAALETVRVRQLGEPVALRFIRGVDGNAAVVEPGRPLAPGPGGERRWELYQPPSTGSVWSIEAEAPTTVIIERVAERSPRYASVEVEQEILRWIATGEPATGMPELLEPADDLARELRLHAALADELERLGGDERRFTGGVEAWRMLAAINELDRTRPVVRPYYVRGNRRDRELSLAGTSSVRLDAENSREYRLARGPRSWTLTRKGPGQLRIAGRAWAPAGKELRAAELRVYAGGRLVERLPLSTRRAKLSLDPDTALPRLVPLLTGAGEPVGELAELNVVLAPGRRDYEIELVGGPALLSVEGARRAEASLLSLSGRTPRKRARAAERAVAKTSSPAREWLELLLAAQLMRPLPLAVDDPRLDDLAARSPLLAVAVLAHLAGARELDGDALAVLVERVRPLFTTLTRDPSVEPEVRGQLRARWLALAAAHARPDLARALVEQVPGGADPVLELPVEGLRLLADLFMPSYATIRSPALAVLELARGRAPADEQLREQALRLWTAASRWSRRRPLPTDPDEVLEPVGQWVIPRQSVPEDLDELDRTWLRVEAGQPVRVEAELGPDAVRRELGKGEAFEPLRRMRLFDIHVATPVGDPAPVMLQVDGERWWSPMLESVQRHRLAVAEGSHELLLEGPPQTVAWASIRPSEGQALEPGDIGRRERMWPLARSIWRMPGPKIPGVVRVELRWPADIEPRPVRITLTQLGDFDAGEAPPDKVLLFDPRTPEAAAGGRAGGDDDGIEAMRIDTQATPIFGSPWASARHDINFTIAANTDALRFEVEDGVELGASISLRRGLQPDDLEDEDEDDAGASSPVRSSELDEAFGGLTALGGEAMLDELRDLSRVLLLTPDDLEHRARRAALLLMLGETGHARADLLRLSEWAENEELSRRDRAEALLAELERRFEALIEPREIVIDDPERSLDPVLVAPALAAVVGDDRAALEPWLATWAGLRELSVDEALVKIDVEIAALLAARPRPRGSGSERASSDSERALLLARLTRAELLSRDPERARDAGRAWLELYGRMPGAPGKLREPLAVGFGAVAPLLLHLDDPASDARDAGLAFGLARELEPAYGHTSVRRLAFIAALRSDWSSLDHSEHNAGFERLELPVAELEPSPAAQVREALLVAPWSGAESEQLRPGRKGVLAWDGEPGVVRAEFWCRAARVDLAPNRAALADDPEALGRAKLSLRLRSQGRQGVDLRETIEIGDAEVGAIELPVTSRARHRLEVVLGDDPLWLCSWRTLTRGAGQDPEPGQPGQLVEARRRAMWWTAAAGTPVELVILGPASLHVEARGITNPDPARQPTSLVAEVTRLEGGQGSGAGGRGRASDQGALPLDGETEHAVITESRRRFEVGHASGHTILLTEPVPYRVRLRTDRGRALLRARVRRDRGDIPPPAQVSLRELDLNEPPVTGEFDWRGVGPTRPVVARERIEPIRNRAGSLDARVVLGLDEIGDTDVFTPRLGLFARVGWRREIIEGSIWLMAAAQVRARVRSPVAGGGILGFGARVPVLGVRLGATLDALATSFLGRAEGSVRLYAFVDRPIRLGRFFLLRPGLTVGLRWQSLQPARVAMAPGELEPHPRVYLRYLHDHPVLVQPELELRAYPFQDMALWTRAEVVPNSDLRGLDHVDVGLGLDGIGRRPRPWVPIWGLDYEASTRFADANRSATVVRHRVGAELGVAVWAKDVARVAFGVANRLYLTPPVTPNDHLLRDVIELWIRLDGTWGRRMRDYGPGELWFHEPWAPRGWGDDEHQAPSTQARRD